MHLRFLHLEPRLGLPTFRLDDQCESHRGTIAVSCRSGIVCLRDGCKEWFLQGVVSHLQRILCSVAKREVRIDPLVQKYRVDFGKYCPRCRVPSPSLTVFPRTSLRSK